MENPMQREKTKQRSFCQQKEIVLIKKWKKLTELRYFLKALVYKRILTDYASDVRPGRSKYDGGPIEITLDLYLFSILGISEKQEQMVTSGYTTQVQ